MPLLPMPPTAAPLSWRVDTLPPFQTTNQHPTMTADLATALLNRAANGAQLLEILDTIADDVADANIDDAAAHYAAISAPTAEPIQF